MDGLTSGRGRAPAAAGGVYWRASWRPRPDRAVNRAAADAQLNANGYCRPRHCHANPRVGHNHAYIDAHANLDPDAKRAIADAAARSADLSCNERGGSADQ